MAGPLSRRILLSTGLTYHILEWGPELAETVILLHGFLDFAWTWEEVVKAGLLGRYRLIAPDLRGHGDSDRVGAGGYYHFFDYLADLHDLIAQVRQPGQPVSLIGHSMGSTVAAYYAGAFPEEIRRLALLEGLGPFERPVETTPERVRTWVAAWERSVHQPLRPMADLHEAAQRLRQHDSRLEMDLALRLAERGTRPLPDGRRIFKHDPLHLTPGPYPPTYAIVEAFLSRITCRVLLVGAKESEFRYSEQDFARRQACLKDAKLVVLNEAGHMMQRHVPAALAQTLCDFLGDAA